MSVAKRNDVLAESGDLNRGGQITPCPIQGTGPLECIDDYPFPVQEERVGTGSKKVDFKQMSVRESEGNDPV